MSGGAFDYAQYRLTSIYQEIQEIIKSEEHEFSEDTIEEFYKAIRFLKIAQIYVQRIDWLVSDDDSEQTFHERLKEDLKNMEDPKESFL